MTKYNNNKNPTSRRQSSEWLIKKHETTFEKPPKNPIAEAMNKQKELSQNIINEPIRNMLKEQRKLMQSNLAPTLNILKRQEATLSPIANMLKEQRLSMSASLTPAFSGLGKLSQYKTAMGLIGEELKQQRISLQNNLNSPLKFAVSAQRETVMHSLSKMLKEQRALIQSSFTKFDFSELKQQAMGWQKLNQLYLETASESLRLDLHQLSKPITASMISSIALKKAYESAVHDIESLYEDVKDKEVDNPYLDNDQMTKEFLQEFIRFCKRIGSMLNTLNSSVIWDLLQKIVIIHSLYSMIMGTTDVFDINNSDIAPIEEKSEYDEEENSPDEKHDYEIDIEKDIEDMDIDAGMRT